MSVLECKDLRPDRTEPLPEYEKFSPIMDRILIKRLPAEKAPDGFIVPERYRQHTNIGTVVAIGDGVVLGGTLVPLSQFLKIGDKVHFGEYNAEKFEFNDEEYELVHIQEIRGIERLKVEVKNG